VRGAQALWDSRAVASGMNRLLSAPQRWAQRKGALRSAGVVALVVLFLGWWRWDSMAKALLPAIVFFVLTWLAVSRGPVRGLLMRRLRRLR
jgi:hypothetical protein